MTVWELYEHLRDILNQNGVESAQLEARELAASAAKVKNRDYVAWKEIDVTGEQKKTAGEMLVQRLRGKPVAYILGEWDFYGYTFRVTPDVLIPRSDTECLCDAAIREARKLSQPKVLDMCCGSGCIGIVIAKEVPSAVVTGMDISSQALDIARQNAQRLGLDKTRYNTMWGDVRRPGSFAGGYDILVCNPPYITADEMKQLDPGVKEYEPHLALYGGEDGLDFYRLIARRHMERLNPGACVLVECGWKQARDVAALFTNGGLSDVTIEKDLTGIERIVRATVPVNKPGSGSKEEANNGEQ